jgi:secretion/DNA translocation related TadE-like protein
VIRPRGDRGAATVLVLAVAVAVLAAGAVAAMAGAAVALRHRTAVAADAAAVAAAVRAAAGIAPACGAAARVARADGARLTSCTLQGSVAEVVVETVVAGWQRWWLSPVRLNARAGPADTYRDEPAPLAVAS